MAHKKILLVDDSNTVLMMERLLIGDAVDVIVAKNGREGLEKAVREKPDLIFMDVVMPEMTGLEACKALRANPATKSIPVVMVTTRGEPQSVKAGFEAGCNEYVTKPFNATELTALLKRYLR